MSDIARAVVGGALIGVAAALALAIHGRIAGVCGILARVLERDGGQRFRGGFLVGLVAAGALIAVVSPAAFGGAIRGTPMLALAGLLVGVGTTFANGCTSGHGVCGISRLSPRSFVAVGTFMLSGALTVALLGATS